MAKFAVIASLFVALVAIAEASTYTTITTTVVEEDNPQQRCSQVQMQHLRQCSMYLSQRGSPYELIMEGEENPQMSSQLRQCCEELKKIDQECRCEAIRKAVRSQQQGQWQGEKMQQVVQKAQSLPQQCNMRQPQQCQIRAIWF